MDALFDDDDEEDASTRPEENGVLQFHPGTEDAVLLYVRQSKSNDPTTDVLNAMDEFCRQRHWMMHCGPEKGKLLRSFLSERLQYYRETTTSDQRPFTIVELGSYCGYSAICMAQQWCDDIRIYSIDVDPKLLTIAHSMAELAGVADRIQFVLRNENSSLHELLHDTIPKDPASHKIDFLVLDHAKECYLPDTLHLEETGWLQSSSAVFADNVTFAAIDDYILHQQQSHRATTTVPCWLEYSDTIPDGIERTIYK